MALFLYHTDGGRNSGGQTTTDAAGRGTQRTKQEVIMRESKLIHLSMQFFAEPEGGSDEGNAGGAAGGTESKPGSDEGQNKTPTCVAWF